MLRRREIHSGIAMAWNDLSEDMQEYLGRYKREFDEFSEDHEQRTSALGQQSEIAPIYIADKYGVVVDNYLSNTDFASPISNILSQISKGIAAARTPAQEAQRVVRNRESRKGWSEEKKKAVSSKSIGMLACCPVGSIGSTSQLHV
jgi:hypothetical protein